MKKRVARGIAVLLTAALGTGLMPAASWMAIGQGTAQAAAAATKSVASAAQGAASLLASVQVGSGTGTPRAATVPQGWTDQPDATAPAAYFTFDGEQILKGTADVGDAKGGAGGSYLSLSDSMKTTFPVAEGKLAIEWQDRLGEWIDAQDGTAVNPPAGYKVTLKVKDVVSGKVYPLFEDRQSQPGTNRYDWNGKDAQGNPLPDGFYYVQFSAEGGTVTFEVEAADPQDPPTKETKNIPAYYGEYVRVALDRTAPVLAAVHPLGGGKIAIEARDGVTGVKQLSAAGGSQAANHTFAELPQQAAYAWAPGNGEKLSVTLTDAAGNKQTETVPLKPYVPDTGKQDYQAQAEAAVAGQTVTVGLAQGNGHQVFQGFSQQGPGVDLDIYFTYNHQNRVNGTLGYGWSFNLDSRLTKWNGGDDITWTGFDGASYWFHDENGEFVTYAGGQKSAYPKLTIDPNASNPEDLNAYVLEWPDQLRYRFKNDGRFWLIQDRDQNEVYFSWIYWPTSYGYDFRIQKVKDTAGHEVTFAYTPDSGDLYSTTITELDGIGNTPGTLKKFFFMYNSKGEFVGYRDPSQKITRFVYDSLHRVKQVIDNGNNVREESGETADSVTTKWTYDTDNRVTRIGMTRKQDNVQEFIAVAYGSGEAKVDKPSGSYTLRWNDAFRPAEEVQTVSTLEGEKEAVTTYKYSGNLLTEETDPLGRTQRYTYDANGRKTSELKKNGAILTYTYDSQGDLKQESGPDGYKVEYAYVKNGRHIQSATKTAHVSDPVGINAPYKVVTKEQFNDNGLLASRTDGMGNTFAYTYDANGFLTSEGTDTTYENDLHGNVVKQIEFAGTDDESAAINEYDAVGRLIHKESATGLVEDFEYDAFGRQVKHVQQDESDPTRQITRTKAYNDGGHLVSESDGLTETTYTVDGEGRVTATKTKALEAGTTGETTSTTAYDSRGLVTKSVDSRGLVTLTSYNLAGEPVKTVVSPDDKPLVTLNEYDAYGRVSMVTDPDGGFTQYTYDAWDRVTEQTETVKAIIPASFPVELEAIPDQILTSAFIYDTLGQLVEQKQPDESWTRYAYDRNGNLVETKSGGPIPTWKGTSLASGIADTRYPGHELLTTSSTAYDKLGRLISETDGNGNTTTYSNNGRTTTTSYMVINELGQSVQVSRSDKSDSNGNIVESVNEAGERTIATYDAFDNQTESVNEEGQRIVNQYDAYGRLMKTVETIDASGKTQTVKYVHDAWGNTLKEQRQLDTKTWAITGYLYSIEGDLLQTTAPSGLVTNYVYDKQGRVTEQTVLNSQPSGGMQVRTTRLTYDEAGNLDKLQMPDGGIERYVFDTRGKSVITLDAEGNASRMVYASGTGMTDSIQYKAHTTELNASSESKHMRYVLDGLGRTVLLQFPNSNIFRKQYDSSGNVTAKTYSGSDMAKESITVRNEYDSRGMLMKEIDGEGHATNYSYDLEGQLVRVMDPVGQWTAYTYSPSGFITGELHPLGRDVHATYNYRGDKLEERDAFGNSNRFAYDLGGHVLSETTKEGDTTSFRYDNAGRVIEMTVPNEGVHTYQYDGIGNTLVENRPEGTVVRNRYDMQDRLVSVTEQGTTGQLVTTYTYDHVGNKLKQQDPNGQITTSTYDESGQRTKEIFTRQTAQGVVQDIFEYTYDPNGNLLTEKKPGGHVTTYTYDFMNLKTSETFGDGSKITYTYDNAGKLRTMSSTEGTVTYEYYDNNQLKKTVYPNGDTLEYVYDENGDVKSELVNGKSSTVVRDAAGRATTYTDTQGYSYAYQYDADGYVKSTSLPNGTTTRTAYKPGHVIGARETSKAADNSVLQTAEYDHDKRDFVIGVNENSRKSVYSNNKREQLDRVTTPTGDVIAYEYDGAGNRMVRKAIIQGAVADKQEEIDIEKLLELVLGKELEDTVTPEPGDGTDPETPICMPDNGSDADSDKDKGNNGNGNGNGNNGNDKGNGNNSNNGNNGNGGNGNGNSGNNGNSSNGNGNSGSNTSNGNGNGGSNVKVNSKSMSSTATKSGSPVSGASLYSNGNGNGISGNAGKDNNGQGNANGHNKDKGDGNNGCGTNGNGNGNGKGNGNGNSNGNENALANGNGKKLGLYKKLGEKLGQTYGEDYAAAMFGKETGQVEHILAAIDQIVNGEVNLPPGEHPKLFQRIREVGAGYTIVGTKWTYNEKNEIATRSNLIRLEDYTYKYDADGNLLSDGRSKYEWNARGQLMKVTFPDGFGEKYTYDMFGRRILKSQFNHQGNVQETTAYHYKGDSWTLTDEKDGAGNTFLSYTFDEKGQPSTITYQGQTFWYVYNGHGDVTALTDKNGDIAARYEYDEWGLVTRMYNKYGERVREGIGWIGDLESGNGSPGSLQGSEDSSGNNEPDYHPGIGNAPADGTTADSSSDASVESTSDAFAWLDGEPLDGIEEESSEDITTELVKINPYRYAGYYWDRKAQMYYLQARYYDPREARFISKDTYEGEIENPQSLNMYVYVQNNPLNNIDPTGHYCVSIDGRNAHPGLCGVNSGYWIADEDGQLIIKDSRLIGMTGYSREHYYERESKRTGIITWYKIDIDRFIKTHSLPDLRPTQESNAKIINQSFKLYNTGERDIFRDGTFKNSVKIQQSAEASAKISYAEDMNVTIKRDSTVEIKDGKGNAVEIKIHAGDLRAIKNTKVVYSRDLGETVKMAGLTVRSKVTPKAYSRSDGYYNVFDVSSTVTVPFNKILGDALPKRIKLDAEFKLTAHVGVNKKDANTIAILSAGASAAAISAEGLFYSIYRAAATW